MKREVNMVFNTVDKNMVDLNGKRCKIVQTLSEDRTREENVGATYLVRFEDGKYLDVFDGELEVLED